MKTIEAVAKARVAPGEVWPHLADLSRWPEWGSWSEASVEGGGEHGEGAVRVLVTRPFWRVRERVTEFVPGERMAYELLEGMKVTGYRSTVTLELIGERYTLVRWRSEYEKASPMTAALLRLAIPSSCKSLAKAAERTA